jgi:hypothetical protein
MVDYKKAMIIMIITEIILVPITFLLIYFLDGKEFLPSLLFTVILNGILGYMSYGFIRTGFNKDI